LALGLLFGDGLGYKAFGVDAVDKHADEGKEDSDRNLGIRVVHCITDPVPVINRGLI